MHPAVAGTASVLVVLALAIPAAAQQRPDSSSGSARRQAGDSARVVQLPTVRVIGSILPIAGPAVGSSVPARVSTIERGELVAWDHRLLSNALAREPGVSLYDDLGSGAKMTLVSRGFTVSPVVGLPQGVSVFLDGVPVNEPDAGQVNFDLLPLEHVKQVEFLSGTASLLGPHSLGGAVNLVTRRGESTRGGGEVELTGGSYGSYSAEAAYGGATTAGWRYYAGGGYARERGWRQLTAARQQNGFVNIGRAGKQGGFNLQAQLANGLAETAGSLPFSVYRVKPDSNLSSGDFENIDQLHLALSGHRRLAGGQSSANLYFRESDAERFNVNQVTDPDVRSFSRNRTAGASGDWQRAGVLGRNTLALRLGLGGSAHRARIRIYGERIDPGITTKVESPIVKLDAYTMADYVAGRFTMSGGLRYDVVRVPFRNRLDPARDTTSTFHRVSPRGGVSVALGQGASLYASAGQSFRAPALIELACADPEDPCPLPFALGDDPPLAPVVATTYEAGARWAAGARAELNASAYRTNVADDIFLFPYNDASAPANSTIDGFFANIDRTRREGVELGSRALLGRMSLFANYAYTRATFQVSGIELFSIREEMGGENDVERGDRFPLVPAHVASLGTSAPLARGVEAGLSARYTGARFLRGDEANEEAPLDGYWTADARLAWTRRDWTVQAVVRNVFGARYATFGTFNINQGGGGEVLERFLTPGQPRTVQFVVRRSVGDRRRLDM